MSDSIFQTLDDIIAQKQSQAQAGGGKSSGRSRGPRNPRSMPPYSVSSAKNSIPTDPEDYCLAIKMLITNSQAGALIGAQGSAVKELIQITTARVSLSEHNYPGTASRTVYITGSEEAVGHAASLVVELVAQEEMAKTKSDRESWTWSPKAVAANGGRTSNVDVAISITVPATSAGLLLGKGGSTKRAIEEESGISMSMSDKSNPSNEITQERCLTLTGKTSNCINGIFLILDKLNSDLENAQFVVKGTTFGQGVKNLIFTSGARGGGRKSLPFSASVDSEDNSGEGRGRGRRGRGNRNAPINSEFVRELSASTIVELAVHDSHCGSILGPGGSKLRDIMSLSGANISISNRGDLVDGSRDRKVTIEGSPNCVKVSPFASIMLYLSASQRCV